MVVQNPLAVDRIHQYRVGLTHTLWNPSYSSIGFKLEQFEKFKHKRWLHDTQLDRVQIFIEILFTYQKLKSKKVWFGRAQ